MKQAFNRFMSVTFGLTSIATLISGLLVLTGILPFSVGGFFILAFFLGSLIGCALFAIYEHRVNVGLAEDCNCPIEDIYYARNELGRHPSWIRKNVSSFYGYLMEEKRIRTHKGNL